MHVDDVRERAQFVQLSQCAPPFDTGLDAQQKENGDAEEDNFVDERLDGLRAVGEAGIAEVDLLRPQCKHHDPGKYRYRDADEHAQEWHWLLEPCGNFRRVLRNVV